MDARKKFWDAALGNNQVVCTLGKAALTEAETEIKTLREKLRVAIHAMEYEYSYQCMNYNEPNRRLYAALAKIKEE